MIENQHEYKATKNLVKCLAHIAHLSEGIESPFDLPFHESLIDVLKLQLNDLLEKMEVWEAQNDLTTTGHNYHGNQSD